MGSQLFEETVDPVVYGTDSQDSADGDEESTVDSNIVEVPETDIPLSDVSLVRLKQEINPLANAEDFGKNIFINTVRVLFRLMSKRDSSLHSVD